MGVGEFFSNLGMSLNPEARSVEAYKQKQQSLDPYEQFMAQQYIKENPDADFTGTAYEGIQQKLDRKKRAQAPFGPMEKSKESKVKTVRPGASGFVGMSPGEKFQDFIGRQVITKYKGGQPLSSMEEKYLKKYFGLSESKEGPSKPKDFLEIRKLAGEFAKQGKMQEALAGANPEDVEFIAEGFKNYQASKSEAQEHLRDAAKILYPNTEFKEPEVTVNPDLSAVTEVETKAGKKINLGDFIPKNIKTRERAKTWLVENAGATEEQADSLVNEWVPGEESEEVEVISPDGQAGFIPRENLEKAVASGFTVKE